MVNHVHSLTYGYCELNHILGLQHQFNREIMLYNCYYIKRACGGHQAETTEHSYCTILLVQT